MARDYKGKPFKSIEDFVKDVRLRLDMNQEDAGLTGISDNDTLNLNDIIKAKIIEGVRLVEMNAPLDMFEYVSKVAVGDATGTVAGTVTDTVGDATGTVAGTVADATGTVAGTVADAVEIKWETGKKANVAGKIDLPKDYMRLYAFKMEDWDYAVSEPIDSNSDLYKMQKSKWGGVRGNSENPVVAVVNTHGGKVLEFYSCNDNKSKVEEASYINEPIIQDEITDDEDEEENTDAEVQTLNEDADAQTTGEGSGSATSEADGSASGSTTSEGSGSTSGSTTSEGSGSDADETEEEDEPARKGVYIQPKLYSSYVYQIARLVAATIKDDNAANMDTISNEFLNGSDNEPVPVAEG